MILYPWTPEILQKVQVFFSLGGGGIALFFALFFFLEGFLFQKWVPKKDIWDIAKVLLVLAILVAALGIYVIILVIVVIVILGILSLVC